MAGVDAEAGVVMLAVVVASLVGVAAFCATRGRTSDKSRRYIKYPLARSHAAKRYFPNDGCSHSFGVSRSASSGV